MDGCQVCAYRGLPEWGGRGGELKEDVAMTDFVTALHKFLEHGIMDPGGEFSPSSEWQATSLATLFFREPVCALS